MSASATLIHYSSGRKGQLVMLETAKFADKKNYPKTKLFLFRFRSPHLNTQKKTSNIQTGKTKPQTYFQTGMTNSSQPEWPCAKSAFLDRLEVL